MSSSLQETTHLTDGPPGGPEDGQVPESSARTDRYHPDPPSNLPSSSDLRALRAQLGGSSLVGGRLNVTNIPRFQGSGWTAQAVLAQAPGALLGRPAQEPNGPAPGRPMRTAVPPRAVPDNGNRPTELWYAQAATFEAHQKSEQLTFRRLRPSS